MIQKSFTIKLRNREQILFEGDVVAVSSQNASGPFDILADHSPYIASLQKQLTLLLPDKSTKNFDTGYGIIHVNDNQTLIYIGL